MGATLKKKEFDPSITLIDIEFILKGFRQEITVNTTVEEACDFIDWWNNNPAFKAYDRVTKNKFGNLQYTLNDYDKRETVMIVVEDIKCMKVPFYLDKSEDEVEFKYLILR